MGDNDAGTSLSGTIQGGLDNHLVFAVQSRSSFIQQENFGVPHQSTGDGYALLLAPT